MPGLHPFIEGGSVRRADRGGGDSRIASMQRKLWRCLLVGALLLIAAGAWVLDRERLWGWLCGILLAIALMAMQARSVAGVIGEVPKDRRRLLRGAAARFFFALIALALAGSVGVPMPTLVAGLAAMMLWFAACAFYAWWRIAKEAELGG